jgi:uncharacterized protein YkwD
MTNPPLRAARAPGLLARLAIVSFVFAAAVTIVGPMSNPAPVQAGTAEYMEGLLVKWINDARAAQGIPRLTVGTKLTPLAGDRATTLAQNNTLSHPSCLSCMLRQRDITHSKCTEVVAGTTYPWGYEAARSMYRGWKGSSGHWSALMSRSYKRFGVGVAYRSSNRTSFGAVVLAG